jgi:hypothetical protein
MNLKSFGCSFIFGSDLSDDTDQSLRHSNLTWPAHLARHLNHTYRSYARAGSGNLQIAERVLNQLATNEPALYVIGWTWIDRFDYFKDNKFDQDRWATIMPVDVTETAKIYYRDLHSEYRDKLTTLMSIRLVIDTLKQKGYPFIMTYMDELMFDQHYHTMPGMIDLQEYIRPYMTTFEGQSFLEWSRRHGYPESDNWHPLDEAHRAGGDYIIKVFDKQKTIDC